MLPFYCCLFQQWTDLTLINALPFFYLYIRRLYTMNHISPMNPLQELQLFLYMEVHSKAKLSKTLLKDPSRNTQSQLSLTSTYLVFIQNENTRKAKKAASQKHIK